MLKDINRRRPDRQLERNLVFLAYAIMLMSLSLFALFLYPQYTFYIIISIVVWNILCILITIRILKVSENAIGFGALAAEILNDKNKYNRIDNAMGVPILANKAALDYFKNDSVLDFLEHNIIDSAANKLDLQKLSSAVNKLQEATVRLSICPSKNSVFVAEEWLKVSVKPIYLNKADIFEDEFSLKKIRKETYIFWTVENITAYKNMEQVYQDEMSSLHNFLDFLPVGLYNCDGEGKIEYINDTFAGYLQIDKNDAVGKSVDSFVAYKPEQLHNNTGIFNGNIIFKTAAGNAEAFVRQQNVRENSELKTRGVVIWNLPNDNDLKNKLNELLDKFEWLFSTAPVGIIFADKQQKIIELNQQVEDIFEKSASEIKHKKICDYFKDEAKAKIKTAIVEYAQSKENSYDFEATLAFTKEEKNIQIHLSPMTRHYSNQNGEIDGVIMYLTDTTNKRNLEMQVAQAQKMQADMAELQADLEQREYTATSGGGMIEVTIDGKHHIKAL